MDSTLDSRHGSNGAFRASWHHLKKMFSASSPSDAWKSFKNMVDAMPVWALVVFILLAAALLADRSLVLIALAFGGFLGAVYFTVKRAVRAALAERDRRE